MENYGLMKPVIDDYRKNGEVYFSEMVDDDIFDEMIHKISERPLWQQKIKELEDRYGLTVYHCFHYKASYGECLVCLYVSSEEDEIDQAVELSKDGYAFIYAFNFTDDICSEFGSAQYVPLFGGIMKIQ